MYAGPGADALWSEIDGLRIEILGQVREMSNAFWAAKPSDDTI
jgi:hypothetical protein